MNKPLILGVVTALIGTALSVAPARAQDSSFVVTLMQEGPNVVATGSGTINTTVLIFLAEATAGPAINPGVGPSIRIGPRTVPSQPIAVYRAGPASDFTGPTNFGSAGLTLASSGNGMIVGLSGHDINVPRGYDSGSPLMSTSTWDDATFSSLRVTPGTYVWTWGSGANAGSFTLKAEEAAVPEPATLGLMVLGLLGAGFAGRKRRS
jgi:hypothetical protein